MDCVKFFQVICIFAVPFFTSIYFILEFQPDFYKYPKKDISELKTAVIVAGIIHIMLTILLTLWKYRRHQAQRRLRVIDQDDQNNIIRSDQQKPI